MILSGKDSPVVSVIVPCYNHAEFVRETIQSVIDQDYEKIELIVIDDGSKDSSVEAISEMIPSCNQRFVRFEFRHRPNKGLCATLNEALEWCEGEYLSCIASDDVMLPDKTSYQVVYLNANEETIGVFGGLHVVDDATGGVKTSLKKARQNRFDDIFTYKHHLPAPTQMLRLAAVKDVGGYRENLIIEDWSMWLFLTEHGGTLDYVEKVFTKYRRHSGNLSGRLEIMRQGRVQILNLFKDKLDYKKACAMALMVGAHDAQAVSKYSAFRFLLDAMSIYPLVLFSRSFISLAIKMLVRS